MFAFHMGVCVCVHVQFTCMPLLSFAFALIYIYIFIYLSVSVSRSGGRMQRAEPWQLRQEDSDAVWNELAYLKNHTRMLSIEK